MGMNKCCYLCFFYRINDRSEPICCKLGKSLQKKTKQQVEQLAEKCKSYREDAGYTRLKYPAGLTPEEAKEERRKRILDELGSNPEEGADNG